MARGKRLSACTVGAALLGGTVFGVTVASGHGNPVHAATPVHAAVIARPGASTTVFVVAHGGDSRLAIATGPASVSARGHRLGLAGASHGNPSPGASVTGPAVGRQHTSAISQASGQAAPGEHGPGTSGQGHGWGPGHGPGTSGQGHGWGPGHGPGGSDQSDGWGPGHGDHGNGWGDHGRGDHGNGAPPWAGGPPPWAGHGHGDHGQGSAGQAASGQGNGGPHGPGASSQGTGAPAPAPTPSTPSTPGRSGGHGVGISAPGGGTPSAPHPRTPHTTSAGTGSPLTSTSRPRATHKHSTSPHSSVSGVTAIAPLATPIGRFERAVAAAELARAGRLVPVLTSGASSAGQSAANGGAPAGGGHGAGATARRGNGHPAPSPQGGTVWQLIRIPFMVKMPLPFIPQFVWAILAFALALAAIAGISALVYRRRARRQAGQVAEATAAALTDPLTGTLNRRGFTEAVDRELARCMRYGRPFVLAYADVRGLKSVNDTEGHLAGDELLRNVTELLASSARAHDVVGRLGGDEFAILLPEQSARDADVVTKRIEERVQTARERLGFSAQWDVTVGTAAYPGDGQTADDLIAVADRRLYQKRGIALTGVGR